MHSEDDPAVMALDPFLPAHNRYKPRLGLSPQAHGHPPFPKATIGCHKVSTKNHQKRAL